MGWWAPQVRFSYSLCLSHANAAVSISFSTLLMWLEAAMQWPWSGNSLVKIGSWDRLPWPLSAALGYPHRKGGTEYGIRGVGACEVLVCQKLMCFTWKRRSGIVSGEGWTVADGNIGGLLWLSSLHESMHAWSRGCAWSLGTCRMQEQVRGHAGDRESWRRRFGQRQRRWPRCSNSLVQN